MIPKIHVHDIFSELEFTSSRSSGPGGQNVNKVNTKVTVKWDVVHSSFVSDEQRQLLLQKLSNFITHDGVLMLSSQDKRSQLQNKESVVRKLEQLLVKAFAVKKARKATKPSKTAVHKRITDKKLRSDKKKWRQRPE